MNYIFILIFAFRVSQVKSNSHLQFTDAAYNIFSICEPKVLDLQSFYPRGSFPFYFQYEVFSKLGRCSFTYIFYFNRSISWKVNEIPLSRGSISGCLFLHFHCIRCANMRMCKSFAKSISQKASRL